ncbi:MAG: hypothetical protein EOP15_17465 [Pseudomonas sp.]|nr:MAG: hypothetical protein EOP15_17465 [Pseudomonas sp.]
MIELARGSLSKMSVQLQAPVVQYSFRLGDSLVPVNPMIGKTLRLEYLGAMWCNTAFAWVIRWCRSTR